MSGNEVRKLMTLRHKLAILCPQTDGLQPKHRIKRVLEGKTRQERVEVLVILAAHPTKMKKDPVTGRFPVPTMYDISGSAAFFNKADFGLSIERDRTHGVIRVHVQKVKFCHLGYPGVASFQYNTHNGRFVNFVEPATPDLPAPDVVWDNSNWLQEKAVQQGCFF